MADAPRELTPGHRINRYTVLRPLGRGGMGVVYAARDERLGRDVALKMIAGLADEDARSRFWREARLAASVNHPHICQLFEVDESTDGVFLTMELLEGAPLDARLAKGPLSPRDATPIVLGVLGALDALHARGLVHRDVKPSNIFLTGHGPKLLDFGLARPHTSQETVIMDGSDRAPITQAGMILGTPHYMAPEQVTDGELDGRTDLYAVGAVLFHMLTGRVPFAGHGVNALMAAVHEQPPALQGGPEIVAIDRVIRRAMRKLPSERYATAEEMAAELAGVALPGTSGMVTPVRALTRIIVPPLKIARADPDVDYLSFGLADSVSGALASLGDVVVRAPALAAGWSESGGDPRKLRTDADVDLIVTGTLLRSGPQVRITVQLLDASAGTVVGSTAVKGTLDDVFALEDGMATAAMQLAAAFRRGTPPPTTGGERRRDVPATPKAFELFLRGMEHARTLTGMLDARKFLQEAVDEDPQFAPAWAALGRCHRVYGKYYEPHTRSHDQRADEAFRRALELSPQLPLAHRYLTHFEAEQGRAETAIARLLSHARTNRNDAQLFAGLVHACRYAGLMDASLAAHEEARRLDPNVPTSVEYTWAHLVVRPEDTAVIAAKFDASSHNALFGIGTLGRLDLAVESVRTVDLNTVPPAFRVSVEATVAAATEPPAQAREKVERAIAAHTDPEALFLFGVVLIRLDAVERGLGLIGDMVGAGYTPADTLHRNWVFDRVRGNPAYAPIAQRASAAMASARAVFEREGGPALLGLATAASSR